MELDAVEDQVRRGDPDRWRTARLAPDAARSGLMALYAFNLEIARAPWVTSDPALAAIRLAWWRDAIAEIFEGKLVRRHEIVLPLAAVVSFSDLPRPLFDGMIEARFTELEGGFADRDALTRYIAQSAGNLMELAVRMLSVGDPTALAVVRDFAHGAGIAALLRAGPELEQRGRPPLPVAPDVLARDGLAALTRARAARAAVPVAAAPALLAGWRAARLLRRVAANPELDPATTQAAPIVDRAALIARAFSGRW